MLLEGTVILIRRIVQWLEGTDENGWLDHIKLAMRALGDAQEMSDPVRRPDKGQAEYMPGDPRMQRAVPHLRTMVSAMKQRNRQTAIDAGREALREF